MGDGVSDGGIRIVLREEIRAGRADLCRLIEQGFRGIDPSAVEVWVERATRSWESFTGRAYPEPPRRPRAHPTTRYVVRLRLPGTLRNRGYPQSYRYPRLKTAPSISVSDWRERLVALVAHEAFHVHQFREGLRRSEVQAERWADSVLQAWRAHRMALEGSGPLEAFQPASMMTTRGGHRWTEDPVAAAASRWEQLTLLPP